MPGPKDAKAELASLRSKIDKIDHKLLDLLNRRGEIARQIGTVKNTHGLAIVEPGREQQVVSGMIAANRGPLPADSIERIFAGIMIEMRNLQREGKE